MARGRHLSVAFCHLDLGVGGAERFIIDSACEIQAEGHRVQVYTSHYDPKRCLPESKQLEVKVVGAWLPRTIFGVGTIMCSWARMLAITIYLFFLKLFARNKIDCIVVDQVSSVVPLLKSLTGAPVVFYGHFPDMLLASRASRLRRAYRSPFDRVEAASTAAATRLLVNSEFTKETYLQTFPGLVESRLDVLYPTVPVVEAGQLAAERKDWQTGLDEDLVNWMEAGGVFISLNRFERKKNVELVIRALHEVIQRHAFTSGVCSRVRVVVAGGYDPRVKENVQYMRELKELADELDVADRVVFMPNISDKQRISLLLASKGLVYTPENEHFGIVPLEAMARGCPVLACRSGGPTETVVHMHTGLLSEATVEGFANGMVRLATMREADREAMGHVAREHVGVRFGRQKFKEQWLTVLQEACGL